MRRVLLLLAVAATGCQPITIEVKPRTVNVENTTTVGGANDCREQVLPSGTVDLEAMLAEAGLDLNRGCLQALSFGLLGIVELSGTPTCAMPRGMGTLEQVKVEMRCADDTVRALAVTCPATTFDFSDQGAVQQKLNVCLDLAETELAEPVRKAANECRPKTLTAFATGSCSADACFAAKVTMGFRLNSATAQVGGSCD